MVGSDGELAERDERRDADFVRRRVVHAEEELQTVEKNQFQLDEAKRRMRRALTQPRATLRFPTIHGTSLADSVTASAGIPESLAT